MVSPTAKPYARTCLLQRGAREKSRRRNYFLQRGQYAHVVGACVADGHLQCSQQWRLKKEGTRESAFQHQAGNCVCEALLLAALLADSNKYYAGVQPCCLHHKERRIFTLSSQRRCCGGGCDARALSFVAAVQTVRCSVPPCAARLRLQMFCLSRTPASERRCP